MPPKNKIVFYGLWPGLHEYARAQLKGKNVEIFAEPISLMNAVSDATIIAPFIESPVTADIIKKMPKLRAVAAMSTGYDHIDLKAAKKHGVVVSNVPTYGENTVAEHTFALILGLTRKIFDSVKRVKEGRYDFHGLRGVDLKGRTLGVIGTGHIGSHVIRMAKGFEMNVVAYDPFPNITQAKKLGFVYTTLKNVLKTADIVTLHVPLLKQTHHLLNKKNIDLMKRGSFIINTARGGLIDAEALLAALASGHIAGAGLDVLEDENLIQDFEKVMHCAPDLCKLKTTLVNNLLIDSPNTIITPHNAFNSIEALKRIVDTTVVNINAFLKGKPVNVVR